MERQQKKSKSIYGIIALVIAVLAMFVPRIFLTLVLIAGVIFMIIGFINDKSKVYSFISLFIFGYIIYSQFQEVAKGVREYSVTYEVVCSDCDISYTNETGGTNNIDNVTGAWQKKITVSGKDFIYLSAQNGNVESEVKARIYVNGILFQEEKSSGKFAIADVSCRPKDIN